MKIEDRYPPTTSMYWGDLAAFRAKWF